MANSILNNSNLETLIKNLKIDDEQQKKLLDALPQMDGEERIELLNTLKDVYLLNEEEGKAIKKLKDNWE